MKLKLQWRLWTVEDWTNIAHTQFLLRLTDGRSEFGAICLSHGPKCLVSTVQLGWCNGVGIVFLAHFGPVNTNHHLNASAYLSGVVNHIHPFITLNI